MRDGPTLRHQADRQPRAVDEGSAAGPATISAVAATFASRQLAACTDTVRQGPAAGRPVAGSIRWWRSVPSAALQRRTVRLEVASPPSRSTIVCPGAPPVLRWSSVTRTVQPAGGGSPAIARSPSSETSTPQLAARAAAWAARSAASALAVAPRSSRAPAGMRTRPRTGSSSTVRQPATRWARTWPTAVASSARSAAPIVGSTAPSVRAAASRAAASAVRQTGSTATQWPAARPTAASPESARKVEQAASNASRTGRTAAVAAGSCAPSRTATVASPPHSANRVARALGEAVTDISGP